MHTVQSARHLCLVTHARFPTGEPRAERAAKAARDAGFHVHVICLRGGGEPRVEDLQGVTVHRLPVRHKRGANVGRMAIEYCGFALLASVAVLRLHRRNRLSLVQVHTPPDFLFVAGLLPRLLGVTLVLDIRDRASHLWEARFGDRGTSHFVERALRLVERIACRAAHAVVTVHEQYRGELTRNGVDGEKVAIVMNTPDESLIQPLASTGARRASGERFTVAYHGTITAWYGVDVLVQGVAAARTRGLDIHAVVLGEGDALPAAQALAEELGVRDYIEFSGRYLPIEDALRTVADADCGVIPNPPTTLNRFILSNKLFEYVALGVPVVVSRLETIAAHFSPNEVTFFEPGDSRSLADALVWVATHRAEAAARAARARARSAPYAWSTNRARYVDLLDRVAS